MATPRPAAVRDLRARGATSRPHGDPESGGEPVSEALQARLDEFLTSGIYAERFAGNPQSIASFLVYQYVEAQDPWTAYEILLEHPLDAGAFGNVGQALIAAGDRAAGTQALLEALRQDPTNGGWVQSLTELDPAGALAVVEEVLGERPELAESGLELGAIRLLHSAGRGEEARARLEGLLGQEWVDPGTWDLLVEVDPELAEERLRERVEDDPFGDTRLRLAQMLNERGDEEEVVALLESVLRDMPGNWQAISLLGDLDTEVGIAALQRTVDADPQNISLLGALGDQLVEAGRLEEAIEAWTTAFDADPQNTSWAWRLLQHAPDRFFPQIEDRARETRDDELWGDVADAHWQAGRHEEARRAWEMARRIDPGDGEWSGKLRSLAMGQDPLGGYGGHYSSFNFGFGDAVIHEELEALGYLGY